MTAITIESLQVQVCRSLSLSIGCGGFQNSFLVTHNDIALQMRLKNVSSPEWLYYTDFVTVEQKRGDYFMYVTESWIFKPESQAPDNA